MKKIIIIIAFFSLLLIQTTTYANREKNLSDTIPSMLVGKFTDDYGIDYEINDTVWTLLPKAKYHIISCNIAEQYLIAKNDDKNSYAPGMYTRIDYMSFNKMEPYLWGFCLTTYDAKTVEEARDKTKADRQNPMKGCIGFPFSRMKRTE